MEAGERVPADMILLRTSDEGGSVFIRTDQLDGETVPCPPASPACVHGRASIPDPGLSMFPLLVRRIGSFDAPSRARTLFRTIVHCSVSGQRYGPIAPTRRSTNLWGILPCEAATSVARTEKKQVTPRGPPPLDLNAWRHEAVHSLYVHACTRVLGHSSNP